MVPKRKEKSFSIPRCRVTTEKSSMRSRRNIPKFKLKFIAPAVPTWLKGCSTKLARDVIWRTHGDDSRFFDVAQGKWDSQILRFTGAGEVSRRDKSQGGWRARLLGDRQ